MVGFLCIRTLWAQLVVNLMWQFIHFSSYFIVIHSVHIQVHSLPSMCKMAAFFFSLLKNLFSIVADDMTKGNGHKLQIGRLKLGIRKSFTRRVVVQHDNKLSKETTESLQLGRF